MSLLVNTFYAKAIAILYMFMRVLFRRQSRKIVFLSRQSDGLSVDFNLLDQEIRKKLPEWSLDHVCYLDVGKKRGGLRRRLGGTMQQLRLVAQAQLCIVDGYCPAISIPKLKGGPTTVQLWHSLGAFKRFAWQAIDGSEGRSGDAARILKMHRNYDLAVVGGPGAIGAFSEAFAMSAERIIALGLPRIDFLLDENSRSVAISGVKGVGKAEVVGKLKSCYPELDNGRLNVLYAPTFRRQSEREFFVRTLSGLVEALDDSCNLFVCLHPLSDRQMHDLPGASQSSSSIVFMEDLDDIERLVLLPLIDVLVTDYSAIAFEAALAGVEVLFYVPDIASYRLDPGFNIDPELMFPEQSYRDAGDLMQAVLACGQRYRKNEGIGVTGGFAGPRSDGAASSDIDAQTVPAAADTRTSPADAPPAGALPADAPSANAFAEFVSEYLVNPPVGATARVAEAIVELLDISINNNNISNNNDTIKGKVGAVELISSGHRVA